MIFLLDNYDSFTYNLAQQLGKLQQEVIVKRNDKIEVAEIIKLQPTAVVISPGPGRPEQSGILLKLVEQLVTKKIPTLGVCLGMQAISMQFGAKIVGAKKLMHGKICQIEHDGKGVFNQLPAELSVMRYHSLVVDESSLAQDFVISARDTEGELMAIRHNQLPLEAVQFHPESFATDCGTTMIDNFLQQHG